ncbi:MAG: ABC transporter ATP-binding protein [Bacteroidales bacterium]|nr:ABC transporter ATP-binding protein [Bacteroidales bacterium]
MQTRLFDFYCNVNVLTLSNFSLELKQHTEWKPVLHQFFFSLRKGEIVGIVGESGSGKSVTALSIMRLLNSQKAKATSGTILFQPHENEEAVNLQTMSEKELQQIRGNRIAMIFQEPMTSLNPVIKCGRQIAETLLIHMQLSKKKAYNRVIELLNEVMLPRPEKIYNAYPHELSGGQKQRVMIAMAMACNPQILIADEPTTALDVTVQQGILELIKKLQCKYGMSVIFITHDLGVVSQIAARIVVLWQGKVVESGETAQLFGNPQHPYTKGLLACRPPMDIKPKRLPTVEDFFKNTVDYRQHLGMCLDASNRPKETLFRIENLSKTYPLRKRRLFEKQEYLHALQDINLEIFKGETLGLVGESGCGKTTLGRTMLRLIEPTAGKLFYKTHDLTRLSAGGMRRMRKELQIISQDPYSSLNQRITIGEALVEPMQWHHILANNRERKERAIQLLRRVGLDECHYYRYPHEFSGGQRQRINIARALAVNPRFIICDESVSALDVSVQAQVLNLLNEIKEEYGLTYIFISHDLSVVKFMSDRMAVMQNGKIVELNDADVIYANPKTEYTRKLINAIPSIKMRVEN